MGFGRLGRLGQLAGRERHLRTTCQGFITPRGDWLRGDHHHELALAELERRGWEVEFGNLDPVTLRTSSPAIATLLRHGYVRVTEGCCNFEIWAPGALTRDARAEMELAYMRTACRYGVFIEAASTGRHEHLPSQRPWEGTASVPSASRPPIVHGFIRPDGSHVVGATVHHALAERELKRRRVRRFTATEAEARRVGSAEIAELLARGYVRVANGGCDFEVYAHDMPSRAARAELEYTYLANGCDKVRIDPVHGRMSVFAPNQPGISSGRLGAPSRRRAAAV